MLTLNNKTFEELGIRSATLMENAAGDSSLTVTTSQSLGSEPIFPLFGQVTLREEGVTRFVGWLDTFPKQASGQTRARQYVFNGPGRWLRFSRFVQGMKYLVKNEDGVTVEADAGETGIVLLGRSMAVVEAGTDVEQFHLKLREAIIEVLEFAKIDKGHFTYALQGGILNVEVPWESRQDDLALNALRALLKWAPDTVARWDGTALSLFSPDYNADPKILSAQALMLRDEIRIEPRTDLLCSGTKIIYLLQISEDSGYGAEYDTQTDEVTGGEGAELDAPQTAQITIYLEKGEGYPEPGIAAEFHRWAGRLQFSSTATINGINWSNRVGDVWRPGGSFDFGDRRMVCQQITRNLFTGAETLTFGPPAQLGLSDLVALKRKARTPDAGDPPGGETPDGGTLEVAMTVLPDELRPKAVWTVGDQRGAGPGSVTLPAGDYTVEFYPVLDLENGKIYFADPKNVTVTANAVAHVTVAYRRLDLTLDEPFQIVDISDDNGPKAKVNASTAFDIIVDGIAEIAIGGGTLFWVSITYSVTTGEVSAASLHTGSDVPGASEGEQIVLIGYAQPDGDGGIEKLNYRFGPINGEACRQWFEPTTKYLLNIF